MTPALQVARQITGEALAIKVEQGLGLRARMRVHHIPGRRHVDGHVSASSGFAGLNTQHRGHEHTVNTEPLDRR